LFSNAQLPTNKSENPFAFSSDFMLDRYLDTIFAVKVLPCSIFGGQKWLKNLFFINS
jgi:hypothetical protein